MTGMDPRSAYREGAVRGATGAALVILLYEQVIQDLRRGVLAIEQGDVELRTRQINHAISVIGHLQSTLNRERGGGVSRKLDLFYCHVRARLIEAQVQVSKEILQEQISNFLSVREAWIEVDRATEGRAAGQPVSSGRHEDRFTAAPRASTDWKY
jgi:flagellar secretion chaperone FliS